jgi:hypothetical protein
MCGVNYGDIDVDRLLNSLTVVTDPERGEPMVGIYEKGPLGARVAAVREVPDVPQRVLAPRRAQRQRRCTSASSTARCAPARSVPRRSRRTPTKAPARARARRAEPTAGRTARAPIVQARLRVSPPPSCRPKGANGSPTTARSSSRSRTASRASSGSRPASCSSTIRRRPRCSASTFPCSAATGASAASPAEGWEGAINLPKLSEELYRSARWLRVFACRPVTVSHDAIARLATLSAAEVRVRLERGAMLDA